MKRPEKDMWSALYRAKNWKSSRDNCSQREKSVSKSIREPGISCDWHFLSRLVKFTRERLPQMDGPKDWKINSSASNYFWRTSTLRGGKIIGLGDAYSWIVHAGSKKPREVPHWFDIFCKSPPAVCLKSLDPCSWWSKKDYEIKCKMWYFSAKFYKWNILSYARIWPYGGEVSSLSARRTCTSKIEIKECSFGQSP